MLKFTSIGGRIQSFNYSAKIVSQSHVFVEISFTHTKYKKVTFELCAIGINTTLQNVETEIDRLLSAAKGGTANVTLRYNKARNYLDCEVKSTIKHNQPNTQYLQFTARNYTVI